MSDQTDVPQPQVEQGEVEPAELTDVVGDEADGEDLDGGGTEGEDAEGAAPGRRARLLERLEREGDIAADYLEGLLDIADLDGDIDMDVEGERASVSVVGGDLQDLVGRHGEVLEALQELTRLAVQAQTGERSRLMLDVAGYRAARREELTRIGREAADKARSGKAPVRLAPMSAFERKVVHDAVAAAGLTSESEGEEPSRRVVVLPAS
ncbi:MAG TPA: R3H domain-containing nucleic acid-binding protein [Motilibacteraceae bacterium]|nr:R3H domain-containing nucleic acid-binding protein [Motilibacteraceae bacterium]